MKKKLGMEFLLVLALSIFAFAGTALAVGDSTFTAGSTKAVISGSTVIMQTQYTPYVSTEANNELMVPVYKLPAALGLKDRDLTWSKDHNTAIFTSEDGTIKVEATIGSNILRVNGEEVVMTASPARQNNTTFVPGHFIAEAFGLNAGWDENTRTLKISRSEIANSGYEDESSVIQTDYTSYSSYPGLRDFGATYGVASYGSNKEIGGVTQYFYNRTRLAEKNLTPAAAYNQYKEQLLADGYTVYLDTNAENGEGESLCILRNRSYQVKLLATDYLAVHVSRLQK